MEWIDAYHIGDLASIAGLLISLVGFSVTVWNVRRSKSAAERAEEAARDARRSIKLLQAVSDFSAAVIMLEEMKRLHRQQAWPTLLDRYGSLRKMLIEARSNNPELSEKQKSVVQGLLTRLRDLESRVEDISESGQTKERMTDINVSISNQIDELYEILADLKQNAGR